MGISTSSQPIFLAFLSTLRFSNMPISLFEISHAQETQIKEDLNSAMSRPDTACRNLDDEIIVYQLAFGDNLSLFQHSHMLRRRGRGWSREKNLKFIFSHTSEYEVNFKWWWFDTIFSSKIFSLNQKKCHFIFPHKNRERERERRLLLHCAARVDCDGVISALKQRSFWIDFMVNFSTFSPFQKIQSRFQLDKTLYEIRLTLKTQICLASKGEKGRTMEPDFLKLCNANLHRRAVGSGSEQLKLFSWRSLDLPPW